MIANVLDVEEVIEFTIIFLSSINIMALLVGNPLSYIPDMHIRASHTNPSHCEEFRGLVQLYEPYLVLFHIPINNMLYSQVVMWHVVFPRKVQILRSQEMIELIANKARRPGICNSSYHRRVCTRTGCCPNKIHPIVGMNELVVPDRTNLHCGVFVLEWLALPVEECERIFWPGGLVEITHATVSNFTPGIACQ